MEIGSIDADYYVAPVSDSTVAMKKLAETGNKCNTIFVIRLAESGGTV